MLLPFYLSIFLFLKLANGQSSEEPWQYWQTTADPWPYYGETTIDPSNEPIPQYTICFDDSFANGSYNGILTSPYYPYNYINNVDCYFYIYTPLGYSIHLTINYFSTEQCCDYLDVETSTIDSSWTTVTKLRGNNGTVNWKYTLKNNALLHFHTDGSVVSKGFYLTWSSTPTFDFGCLTSNYVYSQIGGLASQNYPETNGGSCYYNFYAPLGYNLQVTIDYFELQSSYDSLRISTSNDSSGSYNTVTILTGSNGTAGRSYTLQNNAQFFYYIYYSYGGFYLNWVANRNFPITLPESSNCQGPDILFLLEASQSINQNYFNNDIKMFLRDVTSRYIFTDDVDAKNVYSTSFGVIQFSDYAYNPVPLANSSRYEFLSNVSRYVNYGNSNNGVSNVANALYAAYNIFSSIGNSETPKAIVLIVNDISPFGFNRTKAAMDQLKQIVQLPMGIIVPGINGIPNDAQKRLAELIGNPEYAFDSLQTAVSGIPFLTTLNYPCSVCSGLIFMGEMSQAIGYDKKLRFLQLAKDLAHATSKQATQRFAIATYGTSIYQPIEFQTLTAFTQTINALISTLQQSNTPNAGQTYLAPILTHLYDKLGEDISSSNHAVLLMGELSAIRDPSPAYSATQSVVNRNADIYVLNEDLYNATSYIWGTLTNYRQDHIINGTAYGDVGDLFSIIGPKLLPEFNNMNCQTR